jgi:probable F420-dependent oxidoreductase
VDRGAEFLSAPAIGTMARAAEELGYHGVSVTDHPFPGLRWLRGGGHQTLDPFVALSVAAATTSTLRLQFALLVLPYRHPYLLAKSVASLDVVSGGRVVLGVGTGYVPGEFAALSANFTTRNETADAALTAIGAVWAEGPVVVPGGDPDGHAMLPRLPRRPPLIIGGNTERAMRRAVRFGDGWMPMHNPPALAARRRSASLDSSRDLAAAVARLQGLAAQAGREQLLVYWSSAKGRLAGLLPDPAQVREELDELGSSGVDVVSLDLPGESVNEWVAAAESLAKAALL